MLNFLTRSFPLVLLTAGLLPLSVFAQTDDESIEAARSVLQADRQAVVAESMQLTEAEAAEFWPLYHQYRAAMDEVGDGLKGLVFDYAALYPEVPDDRAKKMLGKLAGLEKQQVSTRAAYLKKFAKILPPAKALRFAQVESKLDLAVRLRLAASIPLVPITGEIAGRLSAGAAFVEGTAGGVFVETLEIAAKVAAVDAATRRVTLVSPEGVKQTVKVGPQAINFDRIRVGDQLTLTVTQELVVQMGEPEDIDGGTALVALAPKGAKPGGLVAEAVQVIGTITALDTTHHRVTLTFDDGSSRTLPVRGDVDLGRRKIGDKVVFLLTEMVALTVETR
ncbi:MAG: DUF2059 domain-containing protein [Limisphaerales bacterium]